MGYEKEPSPKRRIIGLILAIAFHVALGLVLTSSLGRSFTQKIKQTVVVAIIQQQIKPPPPPADLPKEEKIEQKPRPKPKAFVPKVENIIEKAPTDLVVADNTISSLTEDAKDAVKKPEAPPPPPPPKITSPVLLPGCPPPRYPQRSIDKNEQGLTVFRFLIGTDGSVQKAILVQSSGFDRLDSAAQAAFENCKFSPGRSGDTPTTAWVRQPFRWQIQ